MNKKLFLKNWVKKAEDAGFTYGELITYLSECKRGVYEIVYADDSVSKGRIAGKEIKGVIFALEGYRVFVLAKYAPKQMTVKESVAYCASITVRGQACCGGFRNSWPEGGLLYRYLEQINDVMNYLELEPIDEREIWLSVIAENGNFWAVNPVSGFACCFYSMSSKLYARPVCLLMS